MGRRILAMLAMGLGIQGFDLALAQVNRKTAPDPSSASARIQVIPLELTEPNRYQAPLVLEPIRRVSLSVPEDGILRSLSVRIGDTVRDNQEIAQLDRGIALARLRIAEAEVKAAEAANIEAEGESPAQRTRAAAELDAAQARAELARIALERCTQRAPFAGRILDLPVAPGQYVSKGTVVAELADVSQLRLLLPVPRGMFEEGANIEFDVEDSRARGRVLSVIPLPDRYAILRELATPWVSAWVEITPGEEAPYEAGQVVRDPHIPWNPIAVIPSRAIQTSGQAIVQVLRDDRVANVPVHILGKLGPDRSQVSGSFQPEDRLITGSTVALAQGTFIRFEGGPAGSQPSVLPGPTETVREVPAARATSVAPIGAGGVASPAPSAGRPSAPNPRSPQAPLPSNQPPQRPAPRTPALPPGSVPF